MKVNWRSILSTVAPIMATAAGGPLAGVVTRTLATKLLGQPEAPTDVVEAAVAAADPQVLLRLKEIDIEFEKDLLAAGIKVEEIEAADRASARAREISVKDHTPAILAYSVTIGFFSTLGYMLVYGKPSTGGDALLVMLGSLGTAWAAIMAYYFGSSAGSKLKTEVMARSR